MGAVISDSFDLDEARNVAGLVPDFDSKLNWELAEVKLFLLGANTVSIYIIPEE